MAPLDRATRLYLVTFSLLIAFSSAETFVAAFRGTDAHVGRGVLLGLSGLEAVAALGFLMQRTRRLLGALLVLIFSVASLLHLLHTREVPVALLLYLATTLYLVRASRAAEGVFWA